MLYIVNNEWGNKEFATEIRGCKFKMFLLSVLSSVFPFLYGMLEPGTDLRFK